MAQMFSFIRWAGGKSWLVPYVQKLVNRIDYNDYHEPFLGGASIFFALEHPKKCYLSDLNNELISMFSCVRDNPTRVIKYLSEYKNNEKSYYIIRSSYPRGKYQRAARFIYLNAFSYNGLYRVNQRGEYNVPYGHRKNKTIDFDKLYEASDRLKNTTLIQQDFAEAKKNIRKNDLVYLDPPYVVPKDSSDVFIKYNQTLFSIEDQYRLAELIDWINTTGAYYILSNAYDNAIYKIFKDRGRIVHCERNSLIGGKRAYRGLVQEYLFTNIM